MEAPDHHQTKGNVYRELQRKAWGEKHPQARRDPPGNKLGQDAL